MDAQFRPEFFRRAVRRRWPTVLIALLLGLLAAAGTILTATTEYRSTSVVFLDPLVGNPYSPTTPSTRQEQLTALTTEAGLVLTDAVVRSAEEAAQGAGIGLGGGVQERVATEVPSNSQVVHVSFTASTPDAARFGAQSLAEAYLDFRQQRATAVIEEQVARAEEEIASLSTLLEAASVALDAAGPEDAASAEVLNLQEQVRIYANQLGQLRIERAAVESASMSPGEIVSPARLPGQPEGVPAALIAAALVLVFLGGGLVLAVVQEHLDTRLRSPEDVDAAGVSPVHGPLVPWRAELRGSDAEDGYRLAMNTLQVDGTRRRVVALLGAGMPVPAGVTAGLAQALADAGRTVVVVAAEASEDRGAGLSDALQDGEAPDAGGILREVQPGLHLLGPGRHGADLPNLVQRPVFAELLDSLATTCDVLLVTGPDAGSATGSAAARVAGGAIVVATVGTTREAQLLASARVLEDAGARLEGVLLAQPPGRRSRRRRRPTAPDGTTLETLLKAAAPQAATAGEGDAEQAGDRPRERLRTGGS